MPADFKPTFSEPFFSPEMRDQFDRTLAGMIRKHHIACEELTENQVVKQALACGDIQKLVVVMPDGCTHKQCVSYIPFARQEELEGEIRRLADILDEHSIEHRKAMIE